jgi:hypothetical protein
MYFVMSIRCAARRGSAAPKKRANRSSQLPGPPGPIGPMLISLSLSLTFVRWADPRRTPPVKRCRLPRDSRIPQKLDSGTLNFMKPLVIVDGANVVGSVPDGWWRDRAGAAVRLRDRLTPLQASGLPDLPGPIEIVLVVEGRARDIPQAGDGVRLERATGSGDDKIVDLVREERDRSITVVTADRGLRGRVTALGAAVRGPSALPR